MIGNVAEWCEDWYHETYYGAPTDGRAWLSGGEQKFRVTRGDSWGNVASWDFAGRGATDPAAEGVGWCIGFRVVAIASQRSLYERWKQNYRTDHKVAYQAATEYLRLFPDDTSEDAQFMKRWVAAYEKVTGTAPTP